MLWQVAINEENREKTASFHHFTRWLSQVVFRDFAETNAGVIFHPLGSSRGSVISPHLQPPQLIAGPGGDKCKDLRQQQVDTSEIKNAEQQAAAQHKVRNRIVRSSSVPSAAVQSSAQKLNRLIHNALCRIDRGDHERIRVHKTQVKIVPKTANPLNEKTCCALLLLSRNGCRNDLTQVLLQRNFAGE